MFDYLSGELIEVIEGSAIIDVNGCGYDVICANPYDFESQVGEVIKIYTYFYVREDQQLLYGFKTRDEKKLFKSILNVSGIGPKGAIQIVGHSNLAQFGQAIETEDEKYLTGFPGVGKKTARQMILDLKGKLPVFQAATPNQQLSSNNPNEDISEALAALKALGYKSHELKGIEHKLAAHKEATTDDLIRIGLSLLMK